LVNERFNFSLSLRKEKIFEHFLGKRLKERSNLENEEFKVSEGVIVEDDEYNDIYEINIENIKIPEDVLLEYKNVNFLNHQWQSGDFSFAKTYLLNEINDTNTLKFVIFLLRNSSSADGFKQLIEQETQLFDLIILNLFSCSDIEIKYEITWILINITYISNKFHTKFLNKSVLENLNELAKDKRVLIHVIWLLNNTVNDEKTNLKTVLSHLPGYKDLLKKLFLTVGSVELRSCVLDSLITLCNLSKHTKKHSQVIF
jgi:hypothetical protein